MRVLGRRSSAPANRQQDEGFVALEVAALFEDKSGGVIHLARSESRADRLAQTLSALFPEIPVLRLPGWDCLPYDRAPPSRDIMGRRLETVTALSRSPSAILVTTVEAAMQRLPPRAIVAAARRSIASGEALDLRMLDIFLRRTGYVIDDRVDEPGEAAIRGEVVDLYPAAAPYPLRVDYEAGRVKAIREYDPATQRSFDTIDGIEIGPGSELIIGEDAFDPEKPRPIGAEHALPLAYEQPLETVLDLMPDAALMVEPGDEERRTDFLVQIAEAYESRLAFRRADAAEGEIARPDALYLDAAAWNSGIAGREMRVLAAEPKAQSSGSLDFAGEKSPGAALRRVVAEHRRAGERLLLAAASERAQQRLLRAAGIKAGIATVVGGWRAALELKPGQVGILNARLHEGFRNAGVTVIAASDVFGAEVPEAGEAATAVTAFSDLDLKIGDAVIDDEHGIGVLRDLEIVTENGVSSDCARIEYHGEQVLLRPVDELDRLWRYGAEGSGVTLDRLAGDSWRKRRAEAEADVAETAKVLLELALAREAATAPKIVPPQPIYSRFAGRFPYTPSVDQATAIEEMLSDLAAGRPMDRLICGDVGFGKTEVALRAAAAAVLSGYQVALVAPTTVLARQHLQNFRRRFAGFGIAVEGLSRLTPALEAKKIKAGLRDGSVGVVIGTHAIGAGNVRFKNLGLLIVDEEQRFGAAQKEQLRNLGRSVHQLSMSATPIPRTLQTAMIGLRDLSLVTTPPARRAPIRTFVMPFDPAVVREALMRERRRGGQSFVVCPRVADISPMAEKLAEIVPELTCVQAHGRMKADTLDEVMVGFSEGRGDVLLATNIIETGLDVPRANTMILWRPDRFGLSQLHQLRGRVGRGRVRSVAYLMTDPEKRLMPATEQRLRTLAAADRLGAGFAISARDLDLRGAGDVVGDEQAGHMKLIGIELYHDLLQRALAAVRGEPLPERWQPHLKLGIEARLTAAYVPEAEIRLGLYRRLAHLALDEIDAFVEELEDRFGPLPEEVTALVEVARLRERCRAVSISSLDAGPQAAAARFHDDQAARRWMETIGAGIEDGIRWRDDRLIYDRHSSDAAERLAICRTLLGIEADAKPPGATQNAEA